MMAKKVSQMKKESPIERQVEEIPEEDVDSDSSHDIFEKTPTGGSISVTPKGLSIIPKASS